MIKIDLHTHSSGSPDGSITSEQYQHALEAGLLDYIAITDHDTITTAVQIQKELGQKIIVGQEITTNEGELIGLFLTTPIKPNLSAIQTVEAIHRQGGLVYVPHPFETVRKGITKATLDSIADHVDIIEAHNGRAVFQNKGPKAATWARLNNKVMAASSDAHGKKGLGATFTQITTAPTAANLLEQLATGRLTAKHPPLSSLLYPKLNRLRGKIRSK